jgi:hypothetical protein
MLFEPHHPRLAQAISRAGGDLLVEKSRWDRRRDSSGVCPYDVVAVFALSPTFWDHRRPAPVRQLRLPSLTVKRLTNRKRKT